MAQTTPSISVVIPTLGRDPAVLNLCLVLLHSQTSVPDEIIVVDQTPEPARDPDARRWLNQLADAGRIAYVQSERRGATLARNIGIRRARSDVIVFLDDDIFIAPDFIEAYRRVFSRDDVEAVAGQVRSGEFPRPNATLGFSYHSRVEDFHLIPGGNLGIRSETVRRVRGFDENFVGPCDREDMNFAYRLRQAGVRITYEPAPWIFHIFLQSGGGRSETGVTRASFYFNTCYAAMGMLGGMSLVRYLWKHVLRPGVFCRHVLQRPWLLPLALFRFFDGLRKARKCAASPALL